MTKRRLLACAASLVLSATVLGTMGTAASATPDPTNPVVTRTGMTPVLPGQTPPKVATPDSSAVRTKMPVAKALTSVVSPSPTLPSGTLLPVDAARSILVDQSDSRLFINSGGGLDVGLVSTDLNGANPTRLYAGRQIYSMALDEANHRLYAALWGTDQIAVVDTTTFTEVHLWSLYDNVQVGPIAYAGGKVWFYDYYLAGTVNSTEIQAIDVETGAHDEVLVPGVTSVNSVAGVGGQPDLLSIGVVNDSGPAQQWFSTSGSTLTPGPVLPAGCGTVLTSDSSHLLCDGTLRKVSDLSADGTYSGTVDVAAASMDGMAYSGFTCGSNGAIISVIRNDESGGRSYTGLNMSAGPLAYSPDGSILYAITKTSCGTSSTLDGTLRVIRDPNLSATTLSLDVKPRTAVGALAVVTGNVSFGGTSVIHPVHVTRTDNGGVHVLPDVTPNASGNFTVADSAKPLGLAKYTVTYDADGQHAAATISASTTREVPWDVNDDGYADAVVGSPGEDIGAYANAGSFTVLYSHASGVTGAGSISFDQDSTGVPGANEAGDQLGYTSASGDFNHDGYPDIAVAGNGEDTGSAKNSGAIWIFYGSASGISRSHVQIMTVANTIFGSGSARSNAALGDSLAVGDFNGDGLDDLAVGAAGLNHVFIAFGTTSGLNLDPKSVTDLQPGSVGVPISDSTFGFSLSAGDINGDGMSDLAIGSPYDYHDKNYSVGSVAVVYGNSRGMFSVSGSQRFTPDSSGVPGSSHSFGSKDAPDSFGWQVCLADFNGDGKADLAIGAPGTPVSNSSKHEDAGTVTILLASGGKIGTAGAVLMTQDTASVPSAPGTGDHLGIGLAAGDTNNDHKADLAIYSDGDRYVTVVRGSASGLAFNTSVGWTQSSSGIPGASEAEDDWGGSLRFESFKGSSAPQGLMVGATGENSGQGSVTFIYATSSGLTGSGSTAFSQNSTGVPGTAENGDGFGAFFNY